MIIHYTLNPLGPTNSSQTDENDAKLIPLQIENLPHEYIVMSSAGGNSQPIIRLLFNSGRVWKSHKDESDQLSGQFIEELGSDRGLVVTFLDCFTYTCVYLVRDLKRDGRTVLYGEGKNYYSSLGNNDGEGLRMIYDPNDLSREITHIACCFSFSCCVVNKREIRVCGQDWISSNTGDMDWSKVQFIANEDIVDIKGGNFHLVAYLKDHRFLVAGSASYGQTFSTDNPSSFTYITLTIPIRSFSCSSSRTLVECQDNTYRIYGSVNNGIGSSNPLPLTVPILYNGSKDVEPECVLLFREAFIYVPPRETNIIIFNSDKHGKKYDISDYFPNHNYKLVGILAHNKCLLIYPKRSQLGKYLHNLLVANCRGHFSDISIF